MSYVVFARKYRPMRFADMIGQEHIGRTLGNAIKQDRVHHAYLFAGARGLGKTTTARIFAKGLVCEKGPTPEPCNECSECLAVSEGRSVDVMEIDGASNNSVDNIRNLREQVHYLPQTARRKVYIIDEVHMLTTSAFNALLKTLEEPPPHVNFVFATTEPQKVLPTILSRVNRLDFKRVSPNQLVGYLRSILDQEGLSVEDGGLRIVARAGGGSVRDALTLLDQVVAFAEDPTAVGEEEVRRLLGQADAGAVHELVGAILDRDATSTMQRFDALVSGGHDLSVLSLQVLEHLRDLAVLRVCDSPAVLPDATEAEIAALRAQASKVEASHLGQLFDRFSRVIDRLPQSRTQRLLIEMGLLDLACAEPVIPLGDLVDQLHALGRGVAPPSGGRGGASRGPGGGGGRGRGPSSGGRGRSARDEGGFVPPSFPSFEPSPSRAEAAPSRTEATPSRAEATPSRAEAAPSRTEATPSRTEAAPSRAEAAPSRAEATPSFAAEPTPSFASESRRVESAPSQVEPAPSFASEARRVEPPRSQAEAAPSFASEARRVEPAPSQAEPAPSFASEPRRAESAPSRTEAAPSFASEASRPEPARSFAPESHRGEPAQHRGEPAQHRGELAQHRGEPAQHRGEPEPRRAAPEHSFHAAPSRAEPARSFVPEPPPFHDMPHPAAFEDGPPPRRGGGPSRSHGFDAGPPPGFDPGPPPDFDPGPPPDFDRGPEPMRRADAPSPRPRTPPTEPPRSSAPEPRAPAMARSPEPAPAPRPTNGAASRPSNGSAGSSLPADSFAAKLFDMALASGAVIPSDGTQSSDDEHRADGGEPSRPSGPNGHARPGTNGTPKADPAAPRMGVGPCLPPPPPETAIPFEEMTGFEAWEQLVARIRNEDEFLSAVLGEVGLVALAGGTLRVASPRGSFAHTELTRQPQVRAQIEQACRDHLGAPFTVELVEGEPVLPDLPSLVLVAQKRRAEHRAQVEAEAKANPGIQSLLRNFDAQLLQTKPLHEP